jgi:hypothetical protein
MQSRKLVDRDGARLEQPAEISGQIGNGRFQKHPPASVVHVPETHQRGRARRSGRVAEERRQVGIGFDVPRTNESRGFGEARRFFLVSPDSCDRRELVERFVQRDR